MYRIMLDPYNSDTVMTRNRKLEKKNAFLYFSQTVDPNYSINQEMMLIGLSFLSNLVPQNIM